MSWAFSDESERADRMLFGTVFVDAQHTYELRKQLRALLLPGQRRVHMANVGCTWPRKGHVDAGSFSMRSLTWNYRSLCSNSDDQPE